MGQGVLTLLVGHVIVRTWEMSCFSLRLKWAGIAYMSSFFPFFFWSNFKKISFFPLNNSKIFNLHASSFHWAFHFFPPPLFPFPILKLNNSKPPWKDLAGRPKFIQLATPSYNNQQGKYQDPVRSLLPGWTLKERVLNPNQTVLLKKNLTILFPDFQ